MKAIRATTIGSFPESDIGGDLAPEVRIALLREMMRIRAYEEAIAERYAEGKMRCPTHLSIGQEAVPAALSQILRKTDLAVSSHRAHAHYLGKGGDGEKFIAEIYGKVTGCSAGKGGSMHLVDLNVGFKGSTAIVGNTIPIGVGLALGLRLSGATDISVVYLGDAAVEEGAFYEAANFAALRSLPVLFVCENNLYSVYSHISVRQPKGREIYRMVEAMGMRSLHADGNDVEAAYRCLQPEVERLRSGEGPCFVEFSTYRWREHCGPNFDNHIGYRTEQEYETWKAQDPVSRQTEVLKKEKVLNSASLNEIEATIGAEVARAFEFAERSPFPGVADAFDHVFCNGEQS